MIVYFVLNKLNDVVNLESSTTYVPIMSVASVMVLKISYKVFLSGRSAESFRFGIFFINFATKSYKTRNSVAELQGFV